MSTPPPLSPEEASLVRRTPQQYSLEQLLRLPLEIARVRGGLSNSPRCERRGTYCGHFDVSGMRVALCITLVVKDPQKTMF